MLLRGINPIGWMVEVAYVPSSEDRSHGSSLGAQLRGFCDGTRFDTHLPTRQALGSCAYAGSSIAELRRRGRRRGPGRCTVGQ